MKIKSLNNLLSSNFSQPWRKYRIGIHSEPIRTIPTSVSEPMRIIQNQSEKSFISRLMKNGKNRSGLIRFNPKQQSE